jgi:hypothetical protein
MASFSVVAGPDVGSCEACPSGRQTLIEGSTSCSYFGLASLSALICVIVSFTLVVLISLMLLPQSIEVKLSCLSLVLLPTIDVASDSMYFSYQIFYDMSAFVSCGVLLFLPICLFLHELLVEMQAFPNPVCRQHVYHLWWLGREGGYPTVNGKKVVWAFDAHDNVVKVLIYWVSWVLIVLYQLVYACPLYLLTFVDLMYHMPMILLGYFLYQTKTLAMNCVFNRYMALWLGSGNEKLLKKLTKPTNVVFDFALFNKSLLAEFVTETFPQLIVQSYNNSYTNQWASLLNVVSAVASVIIFINGLWRMLYWKVSK